MASIKNKDLLEPSVWGKALLAIRKAKGYELANIEPSVVLPQSIGKLEKGQTQSMSIADIASILAGMNTTWREYLRECDIEMVDQVTQATQLYKIARKDDCRFDKVAQYFDGKKQSDDSVYHFIAMNFMRHYYYQKNMDMDEQQIRQILDLIQKPDQCTEFEQFLLSNFIGEIKNLPDVNMEYLNTSRIRGIVSRAKTRTEKVYAFAILANLGIVFFVFGRLHASFKIF